MHFVFLSQKFSIPYTQSGNWVTESQLNGPARSEAVSFVIDNFAYVGTGWDGLNTRYNDFWKYDPINNVWSQVTSMPDSTEEVLQLLLLRMARDMSEPDMMDLII